MQQLVQTNKQYVLEGWRLSVPVHFVQMAIMYEMMEPHLFCFATNQNRGLQVVFNNFYFCN